MTSLFGTLNKFISRLDSAPQEQQAGQAGYGFQVLRNTNTELALEPWFDFVIGINGRTIDNPDPNLFATEVRNCAGTTISLGVWSAKGQRIREMYASIPPNPPTLGLSLQWAPLSMTEDVWHILDVTPNSPADVAGLLPYGDYVIGSPEGLVRGEAGLGELVEDYLQRPLRLYVYNHEYDVTRTVTITPDRNWGGQGALGCMLGFGALHRIPPPLEEPPQAPGETLFEKTSFDDGARPLSSAATTDHASRTASPFVPSSDFLVPAEMKTTAPPPGGPPVGGPAPKRKQRAHHALSPNSAMDEYFKEGEQKSREQDIGASSKSSSLPPPPKAGGPPRGPPRGSTPSTPANGEESSDVAA